MQTTATRHQHHHLQQPTNQPTPPKNHYGNYYRTHRIEEHQPDEFTEHNTNSKMTRVPSVLHTHVGEHEIHVSA